MSGPGIVFQQRSDNNSYVVPTDGVITSVVINAPAGQTRALRLGRPDGQYASKIVAGSDPVQVPAGESSISAQVRIPTTAGDVLGEYYGANSTDCIGDSSSSNDRVFFSSGDTPAGSTTSPAIGVAPRHIPVRVTVEPDADHDGYGDTTQDLCPTDATTRAACPQPSQQTPIGKIFTVAAHHHSRHRLDVDASGLRPGETYTITVGRYAVTTGTVERTVKIPACLFPGHRLVRVVGSQDDQRGSDRVNIGRPRADRCA